MRKVTHSYKGMLQDISKSKHPNNFYYEGKNIRIISTDDNITQSITNEKGNMLSISLPSINIEMASLNPEVLEYDLLQNSVVKLKWAGLYKNTNIVYKIYKQDIVSDSNNDGADPVLDYYEIATLNNISTEFIDTNYGKEDDIYNYKISTMLNNIEVDSNIVNIQIGDTDILHPSNIELSLIDISNIRIKWTNDNSYNPFYVVYYRVKDSLDWEILTTNYNNSDTILQNGKEYTVIHSNVSEGVIYEYQIETSDPRGDNILPSGYEIVSILASLYPKPIEITQVSYLDANPGLGPIADVPTIRISFGDLGSTHIHDGKYSFVVQRRSYQDIDDDLTEDELLETKTFKNVSQLYEGNDVVNEDIDDKYFIFRDTDIQDDTTYIYKILALKNSSYNDIVYETDEIEIDITCNINPYGVTVSNGVTAPNIPGSFTDEVTTIAFNTIHKYFTDTDIERRQVYNIDGTGTPTFDAWVAMSTYPQIRLSNDTDFTTYIIDEGLSSNSSYQYRVKISTTLSSSDFVTTGYITTLSS